GAEPLRRAAPFQSSHKASSRHVRSAVPKQPQDFITTRSERRSKAARRLHTAPSERRSKAARRPTNLFEGCQRPELICVRNHPVLSAPWLRFCSWTILARRRSDVQEPLPTCA